MADIITENGIEWENKTPDAPITFVGTLVSCRLWHKGIRYGILCEFDALDGRKIALWGFHHCAGYYGPIDGQANLYKASVGSKWECVVERRTGGRLRERLVWEKATEIK